MSRRFSFLCKKPGKILASSLLFKNSIPASGAGSTVLLHKTTSLCIFPPSDLFWWGQSLKYHHVEAPGVRTHNTIHHKASQIEPLTKEMNEWMSEWLHYLLLTVMPGSQKGCIQVLNCLLEHYSLPRGKATWSIKWANNCPVHCFLWE